MAVENCLRIIICDVLDVAVRGVLNDLITTVAVTLNAQVAVIQAQLILLEVPASAAQLAVNLAQKFKDELLSKLNVLPLDIIEGCFDAGKLREGLFLSIAEIDADITELGEEFVAALSIVDDLNFLKQELDETIAFLSEVTLAIEECSSQ